jgi:ketosteroid isomerase-like protein
VEAFAAVRAVLDGMGQAIRRQDGLAMASHYAAGAETSFTSHDVWLRGHSAIAAVYAQWDSTRNRGFFRFDDVRYQRLGPDAVLALARLRLTMGASSDTVRGSWTGVFTRREGRWALSHEHESFARPAGR